MEVLKNGKAKITTTPTNDSIKDFNGIGYKYGRVVMAYQQGHYRMQIVSLLSELI